MKLPIYQPQADRSRERLGVPTYSSVEIGLSPQGCSVFKKVACAAVIAGCVASGNPVPCIMATAPHCIDCL